jgi:hypothetical protein
MMRLLALSLFLCVTFAFAEGKSSGADRGKQVDFEGEVVEGINRQPMDSLSQVSELDGDQKRQRLYRKRDDIKDEVEESLRALLETY